jgi:anti-anti-sigma factor
MDMAEVDLERDGLVVVATLSGEIDMGNADSVRLRIAEFVRPSDDALVMDVSSLSFIDSSGLHAIGDLAAVLREQRQQLLLYVPHGNPIELTLQIIGVPRSVSVYHDREAAIAGARASEKPGRPFPP